MTMTNHKPTIGLTLAATALLAWASPAAAEDCGSPCTVTRQGLPTFRLVNTAGVDDWDLETSAFGVELAPASDSANTGAFRVEHGALGTTLMIDGSGRVGIGTTAPLADLQISDTFPEIRLDDTSAGAGLVDLHVSGQLFVLEGEAAQDIVLVDTQAPSFSLVITDRGRIGLGTLAPTATLDVVGDACVTGDVAMGSSRRLKIGFDDVDPAEVLAKLADLPVASWRYKTEDESTRHIGPFAEDFQRLFGLGDGETISLIDAQGVALAAIQGLKESLDARDAEIVAIRSRNDELAASLAALSTADAELRSELQELRAALASR